MLLTWIVQRLVMRSIEDLLPFVSVLYRRGFNYADIGNKFLREQLINRTLLENGERQMLPSTLFSIAVTRTILPSTPSSSSSSFS